MIFIVLTFIAALSIEGLGTLVSVIGLSALFGSNPIIIALAIALDLGKIVVVSFLYTHWKKMGVIMKSYALLASAVTMIITSAGAAGYLSGEFQKAMVGTQESSLKVDVLKQQQAKYEERKKQIDAQIAALPEKTTVNQRLRLMNGFKAEQKDLQDKIAAIDKQLPELQIAQIGVEAKAGPILYISKAFDIPVESAVKWVILLIIFVFDPLAVFLIIAGNFLLQHRRDVKKNSAPHLFNDDIIHHDEDEPPDVDSPIGSKSWNKAMDELAEAKPKYDPTLPLELDVDKFLEDTHSETTLVTPPEKSEAEKTEDWWRAQEERSRELSEARRQREIREAAEELAEDQAQANVKSGISSMVIEEGDSLPVRESPEVLPEPVPPVEEVVEPIVEPPEEVPTAPIKEPLRETITLSSLGLAPAQPLHHVTSFGNIKPDPNTVVDASQIDQVTTFQATPYPRPTKKLPAR